MSWLTFLFALFLAGIPRIEPLQLVCHCPTPTALLHRAAKCLRLLPKEALTERTSALVPKSPSWLPQDWFEYLVDLTDSELALAEAQGLCSLVLLHAEAGSETLPNTLFHFSQALTDLDEQLFRPPPPLPPQTSFSPQEVPGVKVRKLAQLDAFAAAVLAVERSRSSNSDNDNLTLTEDSEVTQFRRKCKVLRIVDVGCGVGHLTRALAEKLGTEGLGLEVDAERVATAQALTASRSRVDSCHNYCSESSSCGGSRRRVGSGGRSMPSNGVATDQPSALGCNSPSAPEVMFEVCDAAVPGEVANRLQSGDLVVGLHPCGALGDILVAEVADKTTRKCAETCGVTNTAGATTAAITTSDDFSGSTSPALLMVSCCLAGRTGVEVPVERPAVSATGRALGLTLPRAALKKTNITPLTNKGSAAKSNLDRREARLAMRLLLYRRGIHQLLPGAEMDGLPKRTRSATTVAHLFLENSSGNKEQEGSKLSKHLPLSENCNIPNDLATAGVISEKEKMFTPLANYALVARGLEPLLPGEGEAVAEAAREALPALQRLELLDGAIGDAVELVVNLDRACVLEETGKLDVRVGRLFPKAVSPRNLAIYAWPKAQS